MGYLISYNYFSGLMRCHGLLNHYNPSGREFTGPRKEMPVPDGARVLRVMLKGDLNFNGNWIFLSEARRNESVWMRQAEEEFDEIGFGELILAWPGTTGEIIV